MLTRSKCMAAPEAAGKKNWDMDRASDTFHPPTTVVATPDPILAQSEPRPPSPTFGSLTGNRTPAAAVRAPNPTFGSLTEKQPVTSKDQNGESTFTT